MTNIEKELLKAAKMKFLGKKREDGEDRQEDLADLVRAINKLPDADWGRLSADAQAWYNDASEALDGNEEIEDFEEEASEGSDEEEEVPTDEEAGEDGEESEDNENVETEDTSEEEEETDVKPPKRGAAKRKEPQMATAKAKKTNGKAPVRAKATKTAAPAKSAPKKAAPKKEASAKAPSKTASKAAGSRSAASARSENGGEGGPVLIRRWVIKNPKITAKELTEKLTQKGRKISPTTVSAVRSATTSVLKILNEEGKLKNLSL